MRATDLERLDRDGYVVVEGALDAAWVAELRAAFDAAPEQRSGTQHVAIDDGTLEPDAWERLRSHPAVLGAAEHLVAPAFHVRDLHGRNPLPGFGQQGLHADWQPLPAGAPFVVVTAIFMLDDFTEDNGPTRVVPGSHLTRRAVPKSLAQPLARHPEERLVVGRAGSALVMNGHLWHSGTENRSSGPRRAVQMVVCGG